MYVRAQLDVLLWVRLDQQNKDSSCVSVASRQNWQKEFKKWLGDERLRTFAAQPTADLTDFTNSTLYPVLIISYERVWPMEGRLVTMHRGGDVI